MANQLNQIILEGSVESIAKGTVDGIFTASAVIKNTVDWEDNLIPVMGYGKFAKTIANLKIGDRIRIVGRMKSNGCSLYILCEHIEQGRVPSEEK